MSPRIWPWTKSQRARATRERFKTDDSLLRVPDDIATDGYRCVDCEAPSYAFGHLHTDGSWHDAYHPVWKPRPE